MLMCQGYEYSVCSTGVMGGGDFLSKEISKGNAHRASDVDCGEELIMSDRNLPL